MATALNFAWTPRVPVKRPSRIKLALLAVCALAGLTGACSPGLVTVGGMIDDPAQAVPAAYRAVQPQLDIELAGQTLSGRIDASRTVILDHRDGEIEVCGYAYPGVSVDAFPWHVTISNGRAGFAMLAAGLDNACAPPPPYTGDVVAQENPQ